MIQRFVAESVCRIRTAEFVTSAAAFVYERVSNLPGITDQKGPAARVAKWEK